MREKKGVTTLAYLVSILVAVLSFFVIFSFLTSSSDLIVNKIEEQKCKTYLQAKSSSIGETADFFFGLSDSCPVGKMNPDIEDKDEVFRTIADRSLSCWRRYGSGETDFMSNYDTTGKYCFPCTQINFDGDFSYEYDEFISWMQENGPEENEKTYSELINFKYFNPESQEFENIEQSFAELEQEINNFQGEEQTSNLAELSLYVSDYRNELLSLKNKKISSNEKQFVVFRYQRLNNTLSEALSNTVKGAATGSAISMASGAVIKIAVGGPIGMVSTLVRIGKTVNKVNKVRKITDKTFDILRVLKKAQKVTTGVAAATVAGGTTAGGAYGAGANYNYDQYIDIVGEEEYYRTCGVVPTLQE